MLRTSSWVALGSNPAADIRSTSASATAPAESSCTPRSCRLPLEVSWTCPSPNSTAAADTPASAAAVIRPPGSRSRINAPSAAWCGRSSPGQRSTRPLGVRGAVGAVTLSMVACPSDTHSPPAGRGVVSVFDDSGHPWSEWLLGSVAAADAPLLPRVIEPLGESLLPGQLLGSGNGRIYCASSDSGAEGACADRTERLE